MGMRARRMLQKLPRPKEQPGCASEVVADNHCLIEVPGTGIVVPRWAGVLGEQDADLVPTLDPTYLFHAATIAALQPALLSDELIPVLLGGDPASGKTSVIENLAALVSAPLVTVSGRGDLLSYELLSSTKLIASDKGTETAVEEGPVARAFRLGAWLNYDEITGIAPATLLGQVRILDGARTLQIGNTVVPRGHGFRVFATSNVSGASSGRRHRFVGNVPLSEALLSRFALRVRVPPLGVEQARTLLLRWTRGAQRPDADRVAGQLASWFVRVRSLALDEARSTERLEYAVSLRDLRVLWWAWLQPVLTTSATRWRSVREAAEMTVLHAFRDEETKVVVDLLRSLVAEATRSSRR